MMAQKRRGADVVARVLKAAGVDRLFTLSGNQVMSVFDASIEADVDLIHVRHEAAAVHMADGWGRLTGEPGVALVTAGPGFANVLSALYVAFMAESPLVVLSGHAARRQLGRGAFQEMAQAEMAGHVAKASWTVNEPADLGPDIARAIRLSHSQRPGPVHLSLPEDLLEATLSGDAAALPPPERFRPASVPLDESAALQVHDALVDADRPLVLAGPAMMRGSAPARLSALSAATNVPFVSSESPRGVNDPSLGAFAEVLHEADLIVLLGKKLDFTLRFGEEPAVDAGCRFIQIDAEASAVEQTRRLIGDSSRILCTAVADPLAATEGLLSVAPHEPPEASDWKQRVEAAIRYRPREWAGLEAPADGPLHAALVSGAVQEFLDADSNAVFISDGGEFGQWAQACISAPHRLINGPSGAIGSSIPFALAARLAFPESRIVTMLGDGTFGFHAMEFDTAIRYQLPFIAVVGHDAAWNAELQMQLRSFGAERAIGCELLPTRYDGLAESLGGYGSCVTSASELRARLVDAQRSGLPACLNVPIERKAAPVVRKSG